jgi:hypothetical protein
MPLVDTTKSLLACGIATALALSQSNDEQQLACAVEPLTGISVTAECHEKPAAPLHIEPSETGTALRLASGLTLQAEPLSFRTGIMSASPQFVEQPAAFISPMPRNLLIIDPTSYAPSA